MRKGKQKKPLSKATKALLESLQRKSGIRDLAKRFLIVCEDDKSAPHYFEALKKHLKLSATSVKVSGSGGHTQPEQVVDTAISLRDMANASESTVPFEEVWCVIDGDYGKKILSARTKATASNIKLAVSTMCFEYWILLHFEQNDKSTLDCDGLVSGLREKHIPDYDKGSCDFSEIVCNFQDASDRAEELRKTRRSLGELPEDQNPCSEVYLLVKAIQAH